MLHNKTVAIGFIAFFSQIGAGAVTADHGPTWLSILLGYGPLGVMVAWFMWRNEKQITAIENLSHRIDGMSQTQLIDIISREAAGSFARTHAQELLTKIAARNERGK